jgi:hypothetical protein
MKTCKKCNEVKDLSQFCKNKAIKDGLHYYCKECCRSYDASYRSNEEVKKRRSKERKENYFKNIKKYEEYRENNREYFKEKAKERYKNNKSYFAAHVRKRQADKVMRTPKWLTKDHLKAIENEYALAQWCTEVMKEQYHVDHIVPLRGKTVSGLHVPWNLQVIPAKENLRKRNKYAN